MSAKVFVGNLSYHTTAAQLERFLSEGGEIRSVSIPVDRETGRPRGFAFVEFASEVQAEMATRVFDGRTLGGRPLTVRLAEERERRRGERPRRRARPEPDEDDDSDDLDGDGREGRGDRESDSGDRWERRTHRERREWRQMRRTKRSL
ncbi:MAG: RNA-binding protein [Thermoanaerobaculia bacterium]|nr:RNA-binding protein [Thermoanaerobaculia bacterium]